ncbi:hypothetical protein IMZ48_49005 [Candidatus Bathyarchaeota archaeon]|nr:hypothetical protein [Candidatus Bathyarchaeota archaeon]
MRIYFGNAGPNLTSSFHMIGSQFDRAYRDGDVVSPPSNPVHTLSVPPAGTTIVEMKMAVPGIIPNCPLTATRYLTYPQVRTPWSTTPSSGSIKGLSAS